MPTIRSPGSAGPCEATSAPSRCRLSLRDRQCVTISSGTETDLAARFPAGLDLRRGLRAREEITIGRGLVGTVSFGVTEADRCRGEDDGQPLGTSSWPLIAGRARARVRPSASPDGCLDVTLELSGLVVERPDDGRVPLPDVEVRNRSFGSGILDGCVFPRQA